MFLKPEQYTCKEGSAREIAVKLMEEYEGRLLKKYISELPLAKEDAEQAFELACELLSPEEGDSELENYREERLGLLEKPVKESLRKFGFVNPSGVINFCAEGYRREIRAVASAAAELIAEEKHGDLCCLIAGEYIERRRPCHGTKLVAVHLVKNGECMCLFDACHREITDEYSAYLPERDRERYSRSDLVLSALVDIAPRSIYVYGWESNLKLLRRIQLMFTGVRLQEGKYLLE